MTYSLTDSLTGVKCRATSVAKNIEQIFLSLFLRLRRNPSPLLGPSLKWHNLFGGLPTIFLCPSMISFFWIDRFVGIFWVSENLWLPLEIYWGVTYGVRREDRRQRVPTGVCVGRGGGGEKLVVRENFSRWIQPNLQTALLKMLCGPFFNNS